MDKIQRGVAGGMAIGLSSAVAAFAVCAMYGPRVWHVGTDLEARVTIAAWAIVAPAVILFVCIARLAKYRFFTPEDINGSALTVGTDRARLLQALLQNTLEQSCLAIPVYIAVSIVAPGFLLLLVPAAAVMFLAGRLAFFAGYANGAPSRAFGFAWTFYPTVLLLGMLLATAVVRIVD